MKLIEEIFTKKVSALAFLPPREIGQLWVVRMDEYQHIENIQGFYVYVTKPWRD